MFADRVYGVLDVDSPSFDWFSGPEADALIRIGRKTSVFLSRNVEAAE
jgi:putative methionine-R-sulfoxide reductase with GAF domain